MKTIIFNYKGVRCHNSVQTSTQHLTPNRHTAPNKRPRQSPSHSVDHRLSQQQLRKSSLHDIIFTSESSPQGCSYSSSFHPLQRGFSHPNCHLVKVADDIVLLSLLPRLGMSLNTIGNWGPSLAYQKYLEIYATTWNVCKVGILHSGKEKCAFNTRNMTHHPRDKHLAQFSE